MTDEELLLEMSKGSGTALETLVFRYHAAIQTYLHRMVGSGTTAEDLAQECFVRVMEAVRKKRLPLSFRPWIYKIATNLCRDHWRKASNRVEMAGVAELELFPASENVALIYEKQTEREMVVRALQRLDEERRQLIVLRFYQELKLAEIAEILNVPLGTAKTRLYQAIKQLNQLIESEHPAEERNAANYSSARRSGHDR